MTEVNHWRPKFKPREWQLEALNLWKKNLQGVVSVVTGGGKTIFAQLCMLTFKELYPNGCILVIVPTITLLDQWYVSIQEDLGALPEHIACFSGEEKPKSLKEINLIVINTARSIIKKITSKNLETFLIVDECHRAGSSENAKALSGQHKATLGLSATPERDYDSGFEDLVIPILGDLIYTYDYIRARKDNVIVPFRLINVKVNFLPYEQKKYDHITRKIAIQIQKIKASNVSDDQLKILLQRRAMISNSAKMRIPVAAKIAEQHLDQRTLIFHERVTSAENLKDILSARNHNVTIYHSNMGSAYRRDNLILYRRGVFDILISCRALDEGLNVPETEVAIIASATASHRQRIQRLGRVLRPSKGKHAATIYTLYVTEQEEQRLIHEALELEDTALVKWYRGTKNG